MSPGAPTLADAERHVEAGVHRYRLGLLQDARTEFLAALAILRALGDRDGEGNALGILGAICRELGVLDEARRHLERALEIRQGLDDVHGVGTTLNNLATVHVELGRHVDARACLEQALSIRRDLGDHHGERATLHNLAELHRRLGDFDVAQTLYEQALASARGSGDDVSEGIVLGSLAVLLEQRGRHDDALTLVRRSIASARATGDRGGEGIGYINLGGALQRVGRPHEALDEFERALWICRQVGNRVGQVEALAGLGATHRQLGDRRMSRTAMEQAIGVVEDVRGEIHDHATRMSYRATRANLYDGYVQHLAEDGELERALHVAERGRAQTLVELLVAAGHRQPGSWSDEALEASTAWAVQRIRSELLGPDTALLEYVVGGRCSHMFCVVQDRIAVFQLPPAQQLADQIRGLREAVADWASSEYPHGHELYRALIAPAARLIAGKRLLIVPDGPLHYLPFSLLLRDPPQAGTGPWDWPSLAYLIRSHAISYAPSATVAGMVSRRARAAMDRPYAEKLAAFGDPVAVSRLPHSAEEVWSIAELLSPPGALGAPEQRPQTYDGHGILARAGAAATKAAIVELASAGRSYRYVHFACHGLLDIEQPGDSGLLLGPSLTDDVWRADEIMTADLRCELAVLSACETGLGQVMRGEGVVGLSRAFLLAGATAVCGTLWRVDDEGTAELMRMFYRRLLDRGDPCKAQTLALAQLGALDHADMCHPFFWASFALVGND